MRPTSKNQRRISRRSAWAGAAALSALLLTACSDGGEPKADPPETLELETSGSPSPDESAEEQQVLAGFEGYRGLVNEVKKNKRELGDRTMQQFAVDPYATKIAQQLASEQSAGFVTRGEEEYVPLDVTVSGDQATVVTCWDSSTATTVNTYQKPPATVQPAPRLRVTFTLQRSGGRWLVSGREPGKAC